MYAKAYSDGLPASDGFNTDFSGLAKSIDDFYNSFNADMSGIIISGNGFVAGGGGIDFAFVSVKGDGVFILITPRGGLGGDLSVSAGWIKGNSFLTNPSGASLKGGSMSESLGALGITVGYWSDFSSKTLESGNIWEGTIGQITLGSKTVVGGNWSVGETYVIKVYSYGIN